MRRTRKRQFLARLRYKYIALFISASLFLTMALTLAYYWYFNRVYERQTRQYLESLTKESADHLEQTMEQIRTIILSVQSIDLVQDFLYGIDHQAYTTSQYARIRNNVRDAVYSSILWTDSVTNVYMESDMGYSEVWEKSGGGVIWNRSRKEMIYSGGGRPVWLGLDQSGRFMQVGAQINSKRNMRALGFLMLQIPADDFRNMLDQISSTFGESSLIVDKNRSMILGTDSDIEEPPGEICDLLRGEDVTDQILRVTLGRDKYYVMVRELKHADWYFISLFPRFSFFAVLMELRTIVFGVGALIVLLVCVIMYYLISKFTRGIEDLQKTMQRFGEGDFNVISAVRSNDEIGQLSQHFNMMAFNINDLIDRVYNANMLQQKAELESLQMQINPHFLYNTLDIIAWISRTNGVPEAAEITLALSNMMRYTIKGSPMTTLKKELENIRNYLTIQKYRYSDRIQFVIEADESLMENSLPKLLIQPLIENAVIHGVENVEKGIVRLTVCKEDAGMRISVSDNGVGIDPERIARILSEDGMLLENHDSIGLRNVNSRLKIQYQQNTGLKIESSPGKGTTVSMLIPDERR